MANSARGPILSRAQFHAQQLILSRTKNAQTSRIPACDLCYRATIVRIAITSEVPY